MKCSIVMSSFNKAEALNRTLSSIRKQTVPFEYDIHVTDDGSTDNTKEVCLRHGVVYHYLNRPEYCNPAAAHNISFRAARGEILILQSDEVMHVTENAIEQLVNRLDSEHFCLARVHNVDKDGKFIEEYIGPSNRRELFFLGSVHRKYIYAIGGDDEDFITPGYEDNWLSQRLMQGQRLKINYLDDVLGYHYNHPRPRYSFAPAQKVFHSKMEAAKSGRSPWCSPTGPWEYV